jgi:hypothetical protein
MSLLPHVEERVQFCVLLNMMLWWSGRKVCGRLWGLPCTERSRQGSRLR